MLRMDQWVLDETDGLIPLSKWQKTVDVMARVFDAPAGFIVQFTPLGYQVVISSDQESNPYSAGSVIPLDTNIFCRKIIEESTGLYVKDASDDPVWATNPEVRDDGFCSYLGLPLYWPSGDPFGTICVMDFNATDYRHDYVELMEELKGLIESDLEILSQYQLISNMAMTDELTGLYNRRGFNSVSRQYVALAKRSGITLGLLYLDLDGLKEINDVQGHSSGDQALIELADSIGYAVRENDITARLAGDEFVVLAAAENQEQLEMISQRICEDMSSKGLSVSIGGVMLDKRNRPLEHWLELADRKMYEQKRTH